MRYKCMLPHMRSVYVLSITMEVPISNLVTGKIIVDKYGTARASCSLRNISVHATFFCKGVCRLKSEKGENKLGHLYNFYSSFSLFCTVIYSFSSIEVTIVLPYSIFIYSARSMLVHSP